MSNPKDNPKVTEENNTSSQDANTNSQDTNTSSQDDNISPQDAQAAQDEWNEGIDWNKKDEDIDFDFKSEQYYRISWKQLCKQACTNKAEDLLFMDRLILRARYVHKNKEFQKKNYFDGEKNLKQLALISAILNAVRFYHFNDLIKIIWPKEGDAINIAIDNVLNALCVVISAIIAWQTSMILINSPKETWLRHMSFYSKITLEADSLFAGAGEYEELSAKEKIVHFKTKTVTYTEDDYQNFFANMTGNKDANRDTDKDSDVNAADSGQKTGI